MARTIAIIQARFGSSRLPGKALRPIQGRPLISHVIERAQAIPGIDGVVLATTGREEDDGLANEATARGLAVIRGSVDDVLDRIYLAAALSGAEVVMRLTGDCPFLDPAIASEVLTAYQRGSNQYWWNDTRSGYPDGTDVEVFSYEALHQAKKHATALRDREHVTTWIRENYVTGRITSVVDLSWLKLSVDTMQDYQQACEIAKRLPAGKFSVYETVQAYQQFARDEWSQSR